MAGMTTSRFDRCAFKNEVVPIEFTTNVAITQVIVMGLCYCLLGQRFCLSNTLLSVSIEKPGDSDPTLTEE